MRARGYSVRSAASTASSATSPESLTYAGSIRRASALIRTCANGRRAGDMRHARAAEADQERVDAFIGATEGQRTAAGERAQKNLQSAIAADVVERRPLLQRGGRDRARQGSQRMHDELRRAAGAGGRQYPFGFAARRAGGLPAAATASRTARRGALRSLALRRRHGPAHRPPPRARQRPIAQAPSPAGTA